MEEVQGNGSLPIVAFHIMQVHTAGPSHYFRFVEEINHSSRDVEYASKPLTCMCLVMQLQFHPPSCFPSPSAVNANFLVLEEGWEGQAGKDMLRKVMRAVADNHRP